MGPICAIMSLMLRLLVFALFLSLSAFAQNALLLPDAHIQFVDNNGKPLSGGKIYTCTAGTSCPGNPLATYTSSTGVTPNTNPVILDYTGYASIWLGSGAYKIVAQNSAGVQMWTQDNVIGAPTSASFINYTATGTGAVSRSISGKLGDNISVKDYGAMGDGVTDDTAAFNAALTAANQSGAQGYVLAPSANYVIGGAVNIPTGTTLELQSGAYNMNTNGRFTMNAQGSKLLCSGGVDSAVINVGQNYVGSVGVVAVTSGSGDVSSTVEGCTISFYQPSTSNRASLIQYVPAISLQGRAKVLHTKITQAWIGVDMASASLNGGEIIDDLQISAFRYAINIDNTADTIRLNNIHIWPYVLVSDNNKLTAYENPANIGINSGRCDDLEISNLLTFVGLGLNLYTGTGALPGTTFGTITSSGFDTFGGISMSAGNIHASSVYFSLGSTSTVSSIALSGGTLNLSSYYFTSTGGPHMVNMTGGNMTMVDGLITSSGTTGGNLFEINNPAADLRVDNTMISISTLDETVFNDDSGYLVVRGSRFVKASNTVYAAAVIHFASGNSRGDIADNQTNDTGTGSGMFVQVVTDSLIWVHDNMLLNYTVSIVGGATHVFSHDNH